MTAPPPRPRPFWPWLLLLLAVVLGALAASWYFAVRDETIDAEEVPNVVGLQQEAAEARLREGGFEVEAKRVVSGRPRGTVAEQRPSAGTLYGEGGIVVVGVSRAPLNVEVPDVVGLRVGQALVRLRGAELRPRAQNVASRQPRGQVLRQIPEAGTEVPAGAVVVVIVSTGQRVSDVPDVVGLLVGEATRQLTEAGFRTRVVRVQSNAPEGRVVAQNPPGGTRAARNRVVQVDVSRGPGTTGTTPTQSRVPDTVGEDEATATARLEGAGFVVRPVNRPVSDPSQDGLVVEQSPPGGRPAARGSTVTIFVGIVR